MSKIDSGGVGDDWRIPDALWERIERLLPAEETGPKGGKPWKPARRCMDGIFYVMRTGCQWKALPRAFGAPGGLGLYCHVGLQESSNVGGGHCG